MDANKAEKLAAAKKKLKQFQQKSGSKNPNVINVQHEMETDTKLLTNDGNNDPSINVTKIMTEIVDDKNEQLHDIQRETELLQTIEVLNKEKNELVNSYSHCQTIIQELKLQVNEEKENLRIEREKSANLQQSRLDQNDAREKELKNTVSILIEEKNELAVALGVCQDSLKKMEEEIEESKLKCITMEENCAQLEKFKVEGMAKLEASNILITEELNSVKEELTLKNHLFGDLTEEFKELQIRYNNQSTDLDQKETTLKELHSEMELLNLNMQQLRNAGTPSVDQNAEKFLKENERLEAEVSDLRDQLSKLSTEKDVLAQQYQQYILRLNGQIRTVNSQVESMALEKRNTEATLESKNEKILELESAIAALRNVQHNVQQQVDFPVNSSTPVDETPLLAQSDPPVVSSLEVEKLQKKIQEMALDNDQLAKLVLEKESRIQELEIRVDRIQSELNIATANQDSDQREKLIQAMQSDKTAASRAIAQNRQLKIQLEELEKAFIQLSNDKLLLTEQSQAAVRQHKESNDKLLLLEPELVQLRRQVEELASQRDATIYWRQELEEAHERIQALTHQNTELKKRVIWNLSQEPVRNNRKHRQPNDEKADEDGHHSSSENGDESDWIPNEEHQKLLFHYGQLEKQFERSMANVATLTDEKQKLEHLVLQLQSETETIGEYVSLYQVQRGLLRRRAEQLSMERQRLKERIDKLTLLLPRLAPQLEKLPQWLQLQPEQCVPNGNENANESEGDVDLLDNISTTIPPVDAANSGSNQSLEQVASNVANVLVEIQSSHIDDIAPQSDPFLFNESGHAPHDNFHPCPVCSGRLMTV